MIDRCIAAWMALASMTSIAALPETPHARDAAGAVGTARALGAYGRLPMIFERSVDPADGTPRFVARGADYHVAVTSRGARLVLRDIERQRRNGNGAADGAVIDIRFTGGDAEAPVSGVDLQSTRIHHFGGRSGAPDRPDIPTYARAAVSSMYPGIDVVFYGRGRRLEYDIVVAPGADPSRVGFRVDGATDLSLDDAGNLVLATGARTLTLQRPVAYQEQAGRREPVDSSFTLDRRRDVHIRTGAYDRGRPLVIDPVLSYATYLGGSSSEQGTAIAVDAGGNAYVTGYTLSSDFPMSNAYDRALGRKGDTDVFVSKLNASGTALVWSTYLGGSSSADRAFGIAVDGAGSAYITGTTSGADFPISATAWQKGTADGGSFIAKLGPAGNTLAYSTYVASATSNAIAIDGAGNAYITGSATASFVTTPGALQRTPGSASTTGFVLKLNATGAAPLFATFLGGTVADLPMSIAADAQGNAYVAGWATSGDFPVVNPLQSSLRGRKDAFVTKLDPAGARIVYSTFLGGALDDAANAIAVDAGGSAYIAGETYSPDFPSKDGFQPRKSGSHLVNSSLGNAFVAKLGPSGNTLVYASFLGGEICLGYCQIVPTPPPQYPGDAAYGIAVDAAGHAYVSGIARTYMFPLVDSSATQKQNEADDSAFVAKVGISGGWLLWSTFTRTGTSEVDYGGNRFPPGAATGIAVDSLGAAYVTGDTDSASNFQPTPGAFQLVNGGYQGAIVVKLSGAPGMALTTTNDRANTQTAITLTATVAGAPVSGSVAFMDRAAAIGSAPLAGNKAALNVTLPAGIHMISAVLRIPGIATDTPVVYQIVDNPLACN